MSERLVVANKHTTSAVFFVWKSRLGVPVLVLLHSCLWDGAFLLLNSHLGAPPFF